MIFVNQAGYAPNACKRATLVGDKDYTLYDEAGNIIQTGTCELKHDENCDQDAAAIDFSSVKEEGTYYLLMEKEIRAHLL